MPQALRRFPATIPIPHSSLAARLLQRSAPRSAHGPITRPCSGQAPVTIAPLPSNSHPGADVRLLPTWRKSVMNRQVLSLALATSLAAGFGVAVSDQAAAQDMEKCYGVSLAGQNDLRGRSRHHLLGHVDRRLSGQCLDARPGGHLRRNGATGRPHGQPRGTRSRSSVLTLQDCRGVLSDAPAFSRLRRRKQNDDRPRSAGTCRSWPEAGTLCRDPVGQAGDRLLRDPCGKLHGRWRPATSIPWGDRRALPAFASRRRPFDRRQRAAGQGTSRPTETIDRALPARFLLRAPRLVDA